MDQKQAEGLLKRYENGTCTKEEITLLENWYTHFSKQQHHGPIRDLEQLEGELFKRLPKPKKSVKTFRPLAAAALLLLGLSFSLLFWLNRGDQKSMELTQESSLILPGKNTAFLTLGNGEVMELDSNQRQLTISSDQMAYSDGTILLAELSTSKHGQFNTISTPKGGQYQVQLPDGTQVWLNAASSLTYPSELSTSRRVKLEGEAYFEVKAIEERTAKGKRNVPFIVETALQEIRVLGTHFNVDAYADEKETKTTLVEGAVEVSSLSKAFGAPQNILLKPNQQSVVSAQQERIVVKNIDPTSLIAWKDGFFSFEKESFQTVMRKFGRWYNVDFQFEGEIPSTTFSGKIYRGEHITKIYDLLDFYAIHYNVDGRLIKLRTGETAKVKKKP